MYKLEQSELWPYYFIISEDDIQLCNVPLVRWSSRNTREQTLQYPEVQEQKARLQALVNAANKVKGEPK